MWVKGKNASHIKEGLLIVTIVWRRRRIEGEKEEEEKDEEEEIESKALF